MEAQQTALIVPQDTLDAQRMNRDHWEIVRMQRSAKDKAAGLGYRLIAKKAELKHGEFIPWIEANCEFTPRRAQQYIKVATAKNEQRFAFDACTSIREVLDLGKKPKPAPAKVEPTEDDLKTMGRLQTLAELGATEAERESAKAKLDAYSNAFGDQKQEVIEKADEWREEDAQREPDSVVIDKFHRRLKRQDQDWLIDQLLWAMHQDHEIFKTIAERLFDQ